MRTITRVAVATTALGLLAGCGSGGQPSANASSFEEALGLDQNSMLAREAKVQEAIRACMKAEGFDYIPQDASQNRMQVRMGGPGSEDPAKLRKEGYGIATMKAREKGPRDGDTDPNEEIRNRLSDADQKAYDIALFGRAREENGNGGFVVRREVRGGGNGPGSDGPQEPEGCFGKAQSSVPGGPQDMGDQLDKLKDEIANDTRLVAVDADWAKCMAGAGYDWQKPSEIPDYLFGKMQEALGGSEGSIEFEPQEDQAALGRVRTEEMTIARADADCREKTHYTSIAKKVREEAQQRFLDEHPNLGK